jgi:hypothetical protein
MPIMTKTKIAIEFKTVHQLWGFAQKIGAINIEINTMRRILICDCSEEDQVLIEAYEGKPIELKGSPIYEMSQAVER